MESITHWTDLVKKIPIIELKVLNQVELGKELCNILFWAAVGVYLHKKDLVRLDARTLIVFVLGYFVGYLYTYRKKKMLQMELIDTKIKYQKELTENKSEYQQALQKELSEIKIKMVEYQSEIKLLIFKLQI
jgi:hypothetical protein